MKTLIAFFAGFIVAIGFSGRAVEMFSEAGQCRFGLERDGTFYQSDRHTDNFMRPGCASFGFQGKWKDSERWGWRVSLLGTNSIQARGNMAVNDETRGSTAPCDLSVSEANCAIRFDGSGKTQGFTLGTTYEQPLFSRTSLIAESGLFFFQHHFKAEARFVDCCTRNISYNETSKLWDMPSAFLGVSLRYRDVYAGFRHYWPTGHRALSLTNHEMNQFVVGVVKPL